MTSPLEFLHEEGIKHELSTPYTPQQNGVVERKNRTLIEAARTMLDEYKTSDQFWAKSVNTACHAINRLYLYKILKKTAYELLTGNKPKVHYFRLFGSKCFILNKKSKSFKFAPKVDEGFMIHYGSNAHAYRVFNKTSGCVEIVKDVTFDESNGSQEQIDPSFVEKEELPCEAIKKLALGEVKPQERKEHEEEGGTRWTCANPAQSPEVPDMSGTSGHSRRFRQEQAQDQLFQEAAPTPFHGINDDQDEGFEDQLHEEEDQEPIQRKQLLSHPRVHQSIQRDHPVDNILGSIRRGVTTRSHLANLCEFYSFVSSLEPLRVC